MNSEISPHSRLQFLQSNLPELVGSIGERGFGSRLLNVLHDACGAEHCMIFQSDENDLLEVCSISQDGTDTAHRQVQVYLKQSLWKRDPMLEEARNNLVLANSSMLHADVSKISDRVLRDAVWMRAGASDRLMVCGRWSRGMVGLSLIRTQKAGAFSDNAIFRIADSMDLLLSIVGRHAEMVIDRRDLSTVLTSLDDIQRTIACLPDELSPREIEVCARVIYGMSSIGIAIDLGISEETVMTYRKRAYARLCIGSQRELLLWYLRRWSEQSTGMPFKTSMH